MRLKGRRASPRGSAALAGQRYLGGVVVAVEEEVTEIGLFAIAFIFSSKSFLSKSGRSLFFMSFTIAVSGFGALPASYDTEKKSPISTIVNSKITKKRNAIAIFFGLIRGL
jgi:hypothetical protein